MEIERRSEGAEGISIIIPAHNEANYIEDTIRSIQKSATQLNIESEIIVVNDASTDKTSEKATVMGARVIDVNFRNIAAVRNAGAASANHDYFIFLDADTLLPAPTLLATVKALDDGFVGGGARVELNEQRRIFILKKLMAYSVRFIWQTVGGWAAGCYVFCTRNAFDSSGGFPEEYFAAEEFFISRNLKRQGKFKILKEGVLTSDRKLHDFSTLQLMRFLLSPIMQPGGPLKSRAGLEVLYDHQRDRPIK